MMSEIVVFTDLDGTLLDLDDYSYQAALPAVRYLQEQGIPIVFCSSKTRTEQEVYRRELSIGDPFIVENGGAILIPQGYFWHSFKYQRVAGGYQIIELGAVYSEIRQALEKIRSVSGLCFRGWGDMTPEELAAVIWLDVAAAERAKVREYSETLLLEGDAEDIKRVQHLVEGAGLTFTAGSRFHTVTASSDKGKAVNTLTDIFREERGEIITIGLGDSFNDIPMLERVAIPVLVQRPGGIWTEITLPRLQRVRGIGPEGWARAIREVIPGLISKT
ncbi:mannosyl-3-phosphoglycerate phosphatase [Chloroflexota bacterium]